jgi:hypothetical protein
MVYLKSEAAEKFGIHGITGIEWTEDCAKGKELESIIERFFFFMNVIMVLLFLSL